MWKPTALWFLSYTHQSILKCPQLVTGHSWSQNTESLRIDNDSSVIKIYSHGPDYRNKFHQFQTTCINKTSQERLEVNFQIAAMDQPQLAGQRHTESYYLHTPRFPNYVADLLAMTGGPGKYGHQNWNNLYEWGHLTFMSQWPYNYLLLYSQIRIK